MLQSFSFHSHFISLHTFHVSIAFIERTKFSGAVTYPWGSSTNVFRTNLCFLDPKRQYFKHALPPMFPSGRRTSTVAITDPSLENATWVTNVCPKQQQNVRDVESDNSEKSDVFERNGEHREPDIQWQESLELTFGPETPFLASLLAPEILVRGAICTWFIQNGKTSIIARSHNLNPNNIPMKQSLVSGVQTPPKSTANVLADQTDDTYHRRDSK